MFPPTQRTNKWVIPHTRAKAQVKPLFLSPKLAEGPSEARRNNEKGWICSSDWFIVNIYSFIPVQSRLGPCKDKTAVSKLSPVEAVTCHASSCAIPLRLWQGRQRETGRRCAIRASRRRKQSTVGLYWINSNIEDMSREEGRECSKKNKPKKKPKIWALRIPKATTKLPVSSTGNVGLIWPGVLQQIYSGDGRRFE